MAINPIQITQPQAYSGGVDFSPLSKLRDVYKEAQQGAMQEQVLGQLGNDPIANSQMLIKSGVPSLASLGVQMQNKLASQAEDVRQFNLAQSTRDAHLKFLAEKEGKDSPDYRGKQLDALIASGRLPPTAKDDPAWQAWTVSGQNIPSSAIITPQTASDRKAIRDADQQVMSVGQTIQQVDALKDNLDKALHLGPLTGVAGKVASFMPQGWGREAGVATEMATNEALKIMIGQVKNAFGAQPSNREDQWLLKAQASVDKSPDVQKGILKEARELLVEKQKFFHEQAQEMRPENVKGYYGRGGGPKPPSAAPTTPEKPAAAKTVQRTGTVNSGPNKGKTIVQYSDGTTEYK